jgi:UDP-glucose 4-epimerase
LPTALVTGGAGFIGSHVVDILVQTGINVIVVDNLSCGRRENIRPNTEFHQLDIRSAALSRIFANSEIDWVFHLAAQTDVRKSIGVPRSDAEVNIIGTLNILENCRQYRVKEVIFASSGGAIYGEPAQLPVNEFAHKNPLSPYAVSKLAAEDYLFYFMRVHNLPYIALRYGNVYGPRRSTSGEEGVIAIFTGKLLAGSPVTIFGDGEQIRDYIYVGDVARANLLALQNLLRIGSAATSIDDRAYNIATGIGTTVNQLYARLKVIINCHSPATNVAEKEGEVKQIILDIRKAARELGWQPSVELASGLQKTVDYRKTDNQIGN